MFLCFGEIIPSSVSAHFKIIYGLFLVWKVKNLLCNSRHSFSNTPTLTSMLLFIYYNVVVIRCSLTLFETLLKRTDTYTKKDFLQLSSTFLGAKVINTNLVWRYLTVAANVSQCNKSYSHFLCWSHSNLISWKLKNPVGSELSSQLRANNL